MACQCFARCEADCVCDHDWTPPVVKDMRAEIERLRADIERHIAIASEHATECERLRAELAAELQRRYDGNEIASREYAEQGRELERLRAELAVARADLAVSVGHLSRLANAYGCEDFTTAVDAALAAKGKAMTEVLATLGPCCGILRRGMNEPSVMHNGLCREKHDGCLGPTIYLVEDNNAPEKRCCDECGHKGTDGGSTTESYCGSCGATVPYPEDDLCSECGATSCMLIACPECGGHYSLDEEQGDDIETPKSAASARQMREEYRGASCDDVARRVDECMRLRTAIQRALDDSESGNV